MNKKIVVSAIFSIIIIITGGIMFVQNMRTKDLTKVHYAEVELTQNSNSIKSIDYKNEFLKIMKEHLRDEDKKTFESNFYNSIEANLTNEWAKINSNNIDTYTVFDAISYIKFKKIFKRANEVVTGNMYYFVIVTASSNNVIKYSYIYPYVYQHGRYVLDYGALYKLSLIKQDFTISSNGYELRNINGKNFEF